MIKWLKIFGVQVLVLTLIACSGGGGSESGSNPVILNFSPAKVERTLDQGDSYSFSVSASIHDLSVFSSGDEVYVVIQDQRGVITTNVQLTSGAYGYRADFELNPNLSPGLYQGTIDILFCKDSACGQQYRGSPSRLPYRIQIADITENLSALNPLPGTQSWQNYQGDAAHTGYLPLELNPANFSRRWTATLPYVLSNRSPLVEDEGTLIFSATDRSASRKVLQALNEFDGQSIWLREFSSTFHPLGNPAVEDHTVYVMSGEENSLEQSTAIGLLRFDRLSGQEQAGIFVGHSSVFPSRLNDQSLVLGAGNLFTGLVGGAVHNGLGVEWLASSLVNVHMLSGDIRWQQTPGHRLPITPALSDHKLYSIALPGTANETSNQNSGIGLSILDVESGARLQHLPLQEPEIVSLFRYGLPLSVTRADDKVIVKTGLYGIELDRIRTPSPSTGGSGFSEGSAPIESFLVAFDPQLRRVSWRLSGQYYLPVAVADGMLYAPNYRTAALEVRRIDTGELVRSWPVPAGDLNIVSNVIATRNLIFLSTDTHVYALNRETLEIAWRFWKSGDLSISQHGVLFIQSNRQVIAINLY